MSATVIAFPIDTFRPVDRLELRRWDAAADGVGGFCVAHGVGGFYVQGPGNAGEWIERDEQVERAWFTRRHRMSAPLFCVLPLGGPWELVECRHTRVGGTFRTLRGAFEAVCRTLPEVAA